MNYRKKTTIYNYYIFTKQFLSTLSSPMEAVTRTDMAAWKVMLLHTYKRNGNARRITSVNHFIKWFGRPDLKLPIPSLEHSNKVVLSSKELDAYLQASTRDSLAHMVALFQIDGLLRPSEFSILRSNLYIQY